jgi:hypothetical protein
MSEKRLYGQFFTVNNPFNVNAFREWFAMIPKENKQIILEPFAGANNIVRMVNDLFSEQRLNWACYDISPAVQNNAKQFKIQKRDTIADFPKIEGCGVVITNPPYLAKNSATRRGLQYNYPEYDDLYKKCVDVILKNVGYAGLIIPESFITSGVFHDRLYAVVSLTCKMFDDTDCPVCLALFIPSEKKENDKLYDFMLYDQNIELGTYETLSKYIISADCENMADWKFNDKFGSVGIRCIDDTNSASIRFVNGADIPPNQVRNTSRSITRVSGLPESVDINEFVAECNEILNEYRERTSDVFLTSFKGLRKDCHYRRRLDYGTAKNILNTALVKIQKQ